MAFKEVNDAPQDGGERPAETTDSLGERPEPKPIEAPGALKNEAGKALGPPKSLHELMREAVNENYAKHGIESLQGPRAPETLSAHMEVAPPGKYEADLAMKHQAERMSALGIGRDAGEQAAAVVEATTEKPGASARTTVLATGALAAIVAGSVAMEPQDAQREAMESFKSGPRQELVIEQGREVAKPDAGMAATVEGGEKVAESSITAAPPDAKAAETPAAIAENDAADTPGGTPPAPTETADALPPAPVEVPAPTAPPAPGPGAPGNMS